MSDLRDSWFRRLMREIRRRRVGRTVIIYAGAALTVVEGYDLILVTSFGAPASLHRVLAILAVCGLPVAVVLAWFFELSPEATVNEPAAPAWRRSMLLSGVGVVCLVAAVFLYKILPPGASNSADLPPVPTGLAGELTASSLGCTSEELRRIAVLPFETLGDGQDVGVFAEQLHARLIDGLSAATDVAQPASNRVRVVSQRTVLAYRDASMEDIRSGLRVGTVVAGTVEPGIQNIGVRLELVDPCSGVQLDQALVQARADDRIPLVEAAADSIVRLLRTRLGPVINDRFLLLGTTSEAAFEHFSYAMTALEEQSVAFGRGNLVQAERALARADSLLARAESLDPTWIDPIIERGWLARPMARLAIARGRDVESAIEVGIAHADRALKGATADWRVFELRGDLRFFWFQIARPDDDAVAAALLNDAEADLQRAIFGNPTPARVLRIRGEIARFRADLDEAIRLVEQAYQEDPFLEELPNYFLRLFEWYFAIGADTQAAAWCEEGRGHSDEVHLHDCRLSLMAWSNEVSPDPASAQAIVDTILSSTALPERPLLEPRLHALLAAVLARDGSADEARRRLAYAHDLDLGSPGVMLVSAGASAWLGDYDAGFAALQQYLQSVPPEDQLYVLKFAPELRVLRLQPGFSRFSQLGRGPG